MTTAEKLDLVIRDLADIRERLARIEERVAGQSVSDKLVKAGAGAGGIGLLGWIAKLFGGTP